MDKGTKALDGVRNLIEQGSRGFRIESSVKRRGEDHKDSQVDQVEKLLLTPQLRDMGP